MDARHRILARRGPTLAVAVLAVLLARPAGASAADPCAAAWEELGLLNFTGAAARFETGRKASPKGSEAWIEATLGLAVSLHQRQPDAAEDKARAEALYREVVEAGPGRPARAFALLMLGRLADLRDFVGDTPDRPAARAYYDRLIAEFDAFPLSHLAALYRAEAGVLPMQPDTARQAIDELKDWIERHPGNPFASHQWMLIGLALMYPIEDPSGAARAFIQAERAGLPPNTKLDAYYWRIANLAERAGDRDVAIRYYRRIIKEVQRTGFAYEAQQCIRALGGDPPDLVDPFQPGGGP